MRARFAALLGLLGCEEPEAFDGDLEGLVRVTPRFDVGGGFWDAPFPSDHRVDETSRRVDVAGFPNPEGTPIVSALVGLLDDRVQGWSTTGALYLPLDGRPLPDALPDLAGSVAPDATVFLVDVDAESPEVGRRFPIEVSLRESTSVYGPAVAIAALPLPGLALPSRRRLALVARSTILDRDGLPLARPAALTALFDGGVPEGWRDDVAAQYLDAIEVLRGQGIDTDGIAGLSVLTTGRATRGWDDLVAAAVEAGGMRLLAAPAFVPTEVADDYCIYQTRVDVPVFQEGEAPYTESGGAIARDAEGLPVVQGRQQARMWITVPRAPTVESARRTVVFVRTGAGGDRPLIDRGPRDASGTSAPRSGYAGVFARAGWASVQIDGPLGGEFRNPGGLDEQFALFNVANPAALEGNLRQTALELALVPDLLDRVNFLSGGCPGLVNDVRRPIRLDTRQLALFGHSMGATVAPVAAWLEPRFGALLLSGAGGSWIENVIHKQSPIPTRPAAAAMLREDDVDRLHPALTLLQWAGEPVDASVYAAELVRAPWESARHVLMVQGVVDTYIPPPVANALSLPLGLDLGGPALDTPHAEAGRSLTSMLGWSGGVPRVLPAGLNRGDDTRGVTALVLQAAEDGVEDGHEVVFQRADVRGPIRCFLQGLAADDRPLVPPLQPETSACPDPPADADG